MEVLTTQFFANAVLGLFIFVTLGGALLAVTLKNILHNVLCFALSLLGVAGIFLFLNAEFLALMQIMIYVGAVVVAITFAVMLSPPLFLPPAPRSRAKILFSLAMSLLFFAFFLKAIRLSAWNVNDAFQTPSISDIGLALMTKFQLPFVMVSVVLLVAILGAIITAGRGVPDKKNE